MKLPAFSKMKDLAEKFSFMYWTTLKSKSLLFPPKSLPKVCQTWMPQAITRSAFQQAPGTDEHISHFSQTFLCQPQCLQDPAASCEEVLIKVNNQGRKYLRNPANPRMLCTWPWTHREANLAHTSQQGTGLPFSVSVCKKYLWFKSQTTTKNISIGFLKWSYAKH